MWCMNIPDTLTIKLPYTIQETGKKVYVERNALAALREAQDKVRACECAIQELETA